MGQIVDLKKEVIMKIFSYIILIKSFLYLPKINAEILTLEGEGTFQSHFKINEGSNSNIYDGIYNSSDGFTKPAVLKIYKSIENEEDRLKNRVRFFVSNNRRVMNLCKSRKDFVWSGLCKQIKIVPIYYSGRIISSDNKTAYFGAVYEKMDVDIAHFLREIKESKSQETSRYLKNLMTAIESAASTLKHLSVFKICHADAKISNFLLSSQGSAMLADWDTLTNYNEKVNFYDISIAPPEFNFYDGKCEEKSDFFTFSMSTLLFLLNDQGFNLDSIEKGLKNYFDENPEYPGKIDENSNLFKMYNGIATEERKKIFKCHILPQIISALENMKNRYEAEDNENRQMWDRISSLLLKMIELNPKDRSLRNFFKG